MGKAPRGPMACCGRQQVIGRWRWHHSTVGRYGSFWRKAGRVLVAQERDPPAPLPCVQLCASSVLSLTRPLGKFFIHALITSCLDHILSTGNWGQSSGLELLSPCPWFFPSCHPPSSLRAWDFFFFFLHFRFLTDCPPLGPFPSQLPYGSGGMTARFLFSGKTCKFAQRINPSGPRSFFPPSLTSFLVSFAFLFWSVLGSFRIQGEDGCSIWIPLHVIRALESDRSGQWSMAVWPWTGHFSSLSCMVPIFEGRQ